MHGGRKKGKESYLKSQTVNRVYVEAVGLIFVFILFFIFQVFYNKHVWFLYLKNKLQMIWLFKGKCWPWREVMQNESILAFWPNPYLSTPGPQASGSPGLPSSDPSPGPALWPWEAYLHSQPRSPLWSADNSVAHCARRDHENGTCKPQAVRRAHRAASSLGCVHSRNSRDICWQASALGLSKKKKKSSLNSYSTEGLHAPDRAPLLTLSL